MAGSRRAGSQRKVLHLCSDFTRQRLYAQLVSHLADAGVLQEVYVPVRTREDTEWQAPRMSEVTFHIRHVLRRSHRVLFRSKVRRVYADLSAHVRLHEVGMTHAHFLYSDGAVALRLKKRLGIPYIVAVRNTDINFFARYRPDLTWLKNEILREASRVVFVTPSYRPKLLRRLGEPLRSRVEGVASVVPNGIGSRWLRLPSPPSRPEGGPLRLLYVGDFSRNKNLRGLLAGAALVTRDREIRLTLVGGGGDGEAEVLAALASREFPFADHVGRIDDPDALRKAYGTHDIFVMPSFTETFGVGYIEALSQGLPIIHAAGQGVDGYFAPGTVSESVDPASSEDIAAKIHILANRLPGIRRECIEQAKRFEWTRVAAAYRDIYLSVMEPRAGVAS